MDISYNTPLPISNPLNSGNTTNPWFNIANQFTPRNLHDVIRWARYIAIQSPTTSEVIRKYATYPITDFIIDTTKKDLRKKYEDIITSFKLKERLQTAGFQFFTIGNVFSSIYLPISRNLVCPSCSTAFPARKAKKIKFAKYKYTGSCPKCAHTGDFRIVDVKSNSIKDMNLINWTPEHISVNHNPITGASEYYYRIPNTVRQRIMQGDRLFVDTIPWSMIEAVKEKKDYLFAEDNLHHLMNLSTGATVDGVAVPPLLSLFTLVFYQATLRKANEAIASEFLNPLRIVYPGAQGQIDPVMMSNLKAFTQNMSEAIKRHKADKNYFLIAPMPIGYQAVGGEGKALLVSQEIEQAEDTILLSLGVSRELLSGSTNWTSSTVGLRMMESLLTNYVSRLQDMIDWIFRKVATYLNIEYVQVKLKPFKLIDDEVFRSNAVAMESAGILSKGTVAEAFGVDFAKEQQKRVEESSTIAETKVMSDYAAEQGAFMATKNVSVQIKDNNAEMEIMQNKAMDLAEKAMSLDDSTKRSLMYKLKQEDYTLYILVKEILEQHRETPEHKEAVQEGSNAVLDSEAGAGDGQGATAGNTALAEDTTQDATEEGQRP